MNCLVFDIETVPDVDFARRLYGLRGIADDQVAEIMLARCRQESGSEFLPLEQHRVVVISVLLRKADTLRLWSLGEPKAPEQELLERFFEGVARYTPDLVSWNGGGFDLPVLHYRALRYGVAAPRYWETGDEDPAFRWNNYLSRFHWRHLDLMDVLSGYQPRGRARLENVALLLGLPGKLGMNGAQVWEAVRAGHIDRVRNYCETDVLNTYLIYLRFELMRGRLEPQAYCDECGLLRRTLAASDRAHLRDFLAAWEPHESTG